MLVVYGKGMANQKNGCIFIFRILNKYTKYLFVFGDMLKWALKAYPLHFEY